MGSSLTTADFIVWGHDQQAYGPVELPTLVSWVQGEMISSDTWIFDARAFAWRKAAELPELRMFFVSSADGAYPPARKTPKTAGVEPQALRRIKVLGCMTDRELARFAEFMEVERVLPCELVVKQGDLAAAIYLILEGEFHVRVNLDGRETVLARLSAGDFFGDMSLFDHGPRSADVVADTSARVLKVSAAAFERLAKEAPELATPFLLALGKTLVSRIRTENKHHCESAKVARALELE